MIGGAAISVINTSDVVMPYNLSKGDLMVLTKPLGT
jgi:hydrogenase maturation factor